MASEAEETNDYKDKGIKEEEDPDATIEEDEFKENSTIMSGMDKGKFEDIEIKFEWEDDIEDSEWAFTVRMHCNTIELLAEALKTTSQTFAKELKEFKRRMKINQGPNDIKARAALQDLVRKHKSLTGTVTAALDVGESNAKDVASL